MATLLTVNLIKGDSPSWGFRLQGGKDFGTPLVIQKVIVGSPAERAGLVAGDSVIKVNATDVFNLRHKDAQDVLLRAGHSFSMTIQRGGSTWKPSVVPTGVISSPTPSISNVSPVTRTSLAAKPSENIGGIGTGHNVSAKPFLNGNVNGVGSKLINNQYNSPLKLYSEESIAETLSAQTEVLPTGALGVNFKKNERNYDASKSAVLSLLKEEECRSKTPEHIDQLHGSSGIDSSPTPNALAGLRHVAAPEDKPRTASPQLPPGQNICADCERLIVGVFVRIKDKNLHVECFKCSTCGTSLKNVGYYNINNKLYCDIHAKLAARNNPPAPNLVPITVSPGDKNPANAISAALLNHPAPLSPKINSYQTPSSGPKPFGSVSAPVSSPKYNLSPSGIEAPISPVSSGLAPSYSPASSAAFSLSNIVWPPVPEEPELPSACPIFYPPPSHVIIKPKKNPENPENTEVEEINSMSQYNYFENMSDTRILSGRRSASECVETITESVERQRMIEDVIKKIPPPTLPMKRQDAIGEEPVQLGRTTCETEKKESDNMDVEKKREEEQTVSSKISNCSPKKWESQMLQALTISVNVSEDEASSKKSEKNGCSIGTEEAKPSNPNILNNIPVKKPVTALGSALAVAPTEPFNPLNVSAFEEVPLPEETIPYFPPEDLFVVPVKINEESGRVKFGQKKKDSDLDKLLEDLPKPQEKLTMLSALTTVPDRPFTPISSQSGIRELSDKEETEKTTTIKGNSKTNNIDMKNLEKENLRRQNSSGRMEVYVKNEHSVAELETKEDLGDENSAKKFGSSHIPQQESIMQCRTSKSNTTGETIVTTVVHEQHRSEMKTEKTVQLEKSRENVVYKKAEQIIPLRRPEALPQYQIDVKASAEADLIAIEKMEKRNNMEEQKCMKESSITDEKGNNNRKLPENTCSFQDTPTSKRIICPVVKVVETDLHNSENTFKPVTENRALSPGARNPVQNFANKPLIPYYQANLVAQKCGPPVVNLLDPKSPAISRSPSPIPNCPKTSQLFSPKTSTVRPKSPAQGPPENPMVQEHIPMREDFKRECAKDSLSTFIPQCREIEEIQREKEIYNIGKENRNRVRNTMYPVSPRERENLSSEKLGICQLQKEELGNYQKQEIKSSVTDNIRMEETITEKSILEKSEDFQKMELTSVEKSADGSRQTLTKKTSTEELEQMHKEHAIVLEKKVTSSNQSFRNVNNPDEQHVVGLHITAPNRIRSPFIKKGQDAAPPILTTVCQKVGIDVPCRKQEEIPMFSCPIVPKFDATTLPQPKSMPPEMPMEEIEEKKPPVNPVKHVPAPGSSTVNQTLNSNDPASGIGAAGGRQIGAIGVSPKRGRGVLNAAQLGGRIPLCGHCHGQIRGPFITALGKIWCPNHFVCATPSCKRPLQDLGFVEEQGQLYCEYCFEQYLAPNCSKCGSKIKADCLRAIGKYFHPECFNCVHCGKLFNNSPFFLEDGSPYCETDWNELFTTKCFACGFPVEAGDRWVEALNNNYHSQCFNCSMCKKNLEGQSFFAKGGRPYCKNHAR